MRTSFINIIWTSFRIEKTNIARYVKYGIISAIGIFIGNHVSICEQMANVGRIRAKFSG